MKHSLKNPFLALLVIGSLHMLSACAGKKSIKDYLSEKGYEPLTVPRDFDGTGTIINFIGGKEVAIASPEDCFPLSSVERVYGNAALPEYCEQESFDLDVGLNYLKLLGIEPALKAYNVNAINIKFENVTIERLPYIRIERYLNEVKSKAEFAHCIDHVDKNDFVLIEMIKARPTYEFITAQGLNLELTDTLLEEIGIKGNLANQYQVARQNTLKLNSPLYLGFKSVSLRSKQVSAGKQKGHGDRPQSNKYIKVNLLSLEEIRRIKKASQ